MKAKTDDEDVMMEPGMENPPASLLNRYENSRVKRVLLAVAVLFLGWFAFSATGLAYQVLQDLQKLAELFSIGR